MQTCFQANNIAQSTYRPLEVFTVAAGLYFVVLFPTSLLVKNIERQLGKQGKERCTDESHLGFSDCLCQLATPFTGLTQHFEARPADADNWTILWPFCWVGTLFP